MCRPVAARGLREARQAELVHDVLHDQRDLPHVAPRVALARVEVDQEVVGPVDVVHPRGPRVQVDAAEVDDPGERRRLVADREVGRAPGRELDVHGLEPVGMIGRNALLVEEPLLRAVRVALHLHRAALDVVQDVRRDVEVVLDEVELLQPALREEDLVRVRDVDLAPADSQLHAPILRFPDASLSACMRVGQCCAARPARRKAVSGARRPRESADAAQGSGEGGIRTLDPPFGRYAISSRVPSAARTPLQARRA